MEIKEKTLEGLNNYRLKINRLEERRFIDFTHDGTGRMCTMYHNLRTKRYELEPIKKNG